MAVRTVRHNKVHALPPLTWFVGAIIMAIGLGGMAEHNYASGLIMMLAGSLQLPTIKRMIMTTNPKVSSNNLIFIGTILVFMACMGFVAEKNIETIMTSTQSAQSTGQTHISYKTGVRY